MCLYFQFVHISTESISKFCDKNSEQVVRNKMERKDPSAIEQIREAEKQAEHQLINAETEAAHIVTTARHQADALLQEATNNIKAAAAQAKASAQAEGKAYAEDLMKRAGKELNELHLQAEKNRGEAIDHILSLIV